ncbi:shikimate dehydrogenase [Desulfitispora alkaliphila]|uniref:shikimate dehydrogenase n=1 Tax=Desulfitispora alkaliphila TaxID=622674 RepID=UPI003D1CB49E
MKYGLIGKSLKHSVSKTIHIELFKVLGVESLYEHYELHEDQLESSIRNFKNLGYRGLNVTIPYKIRVMEFLDYISPEASSIGSVNTIKFSDEKMEGFNTDYIGFGMVLDHNDILVNGKECIILGTGGASKAVVKYLEDKGAGSIVLVSRNPENNNSSEGYKVISYKDLKLVQKTYLIVNATPLGMYPKVSETPLSRSIVKKADAIVDLIYNPAETKILKYAREENKIHANGVLMLVGQAIAAQEIWNECKYEDHIVKEIFGKIEKYMGGDHEK